MQCSKSKTIVVVDGYEHYEKRENKLTTAWNCAQYQTLSCRTSAITSGEQLISIRGNHNHDICLGKVRARKVVEKIKELGEVSTPAVSVSSALLEVTDEYATQWTLPSKASLFKVSQRVRQKRFDPLSDPASQNFEVPEEFHSFLVHDTGKEDHERILVFGDKKWLNICSHLYHGWQMGHLSSAQKCFISCTQFTFGVNRNKREAASEGVARTTNAVEGWHFGIQAFFSGSHPSMWKTPENMKKDAATQKYLYLQSTAGTKLSSQKRYRELEAKVKNAIERHQDENTSAVLRAMTSLSM